jgi:RNA polymerase sigma factor (sigma-70 family)
VAGERTYVLTIARRRLIDRLRRRKANPSGEPLDSVPEPAASGTSYAGNQVDAAERGEMAARAADAMRALSSDQQGVLTLALGHGLTYTEIAQRLRLPLGTVKSHARRGLIRLRELLGVKNAT